MGTVGSRRTLRGLTGWATAVLLLSGCAAQGGGAGTAPTNAPGAPSSSMEMSMPAMSGTASTLLDPTAFAAAMKQPGTVIIDVHIPFEGKLNSGDLRIPYNQIAQHADELPADRSTPLAIYCRSGNMSAIAAPVLAAMGYTHIVELRGGMQAWVADGRDLTTTE